MAASRSRRDVSISGAGSSLVAPLVQQWISPLGSAYGYSLTYASVGSGTGIAQITARTVDFGASDAPLNRVAGRGVQRLHRDAVGALRDHPVVQHPGTCRASFSSTPPRSPASTSGRSRTGTIPRSRSSTRSVTLPSLSITPVHRSDGSGDTYAFTDYLQRVSTQFQSQVGSNTLVNWPGGIGASGNAGVAGVIATTPGAIGYISAAYTIPNHLKVASIKNAAGGFATPGLRGHRGCGGRRHEADLDGERRRDAHRQPAGRRREAGVPDLDVHLHHRPAPDRQGQRSSAR